MSTEAIHTDAKQGEASRGEVTCETTSISQAETLASIVATVKHDSRQSAKAYLKESEVQHGGE